MAVASAVWVLAALGQEGVIVDSDSGGKVSAYDGSNYDISSNYDNSNYDNSHGMSSGSQLSDWRESYSDTMYDFEGYDTQGAAASPPVGASQAWALSCVRRVAAQASLPWTAACPGARRRGWTTASATRRATYPNATTTAPTALVATVRSAPACSHSLSPT